MQKMKMVGSFILVLFISKINILLQHAACILSISDYIRKKKNFTYFFISFSLKLRQEFLLKIELHVKKRILLTYLGIHCRILNAKKKKLYKKFVQNLFTYFYNV